MLAAIVAVASAGLESDSAGENIVWLWPCNLESWAHWCEVQTQWQHGGMGGATGLNYAGVVAYLRESIQKRKPRAEVFECIRHAERASLNVWAQQREDRKRD
jgi:hypothetical protein